MKLLCKTILILLAIIMTHSDTLPKNEAHCDCVHCNEETEYNTEESNENTTPALYKEDADGNGNRTICARDRDFNDRTFSSVCHMLCYNRCLILRYSTVKENHKKKHVVRAYRNNYYKLRDGEC
ncbi:uncharacterized protein LOC143184732 [Calliopsis andreniformis]|uniref:uncharacterized protein LOC143184732 n=1 Tax=Calliopsis andreniformis TaxID=337506 RepID=UPI003FCDEF10